MRVTHGLGVAQSDERAVELFESAAAKGFALAQHNLGLMIAQVRVWMSAWGKGVGGWAFYASMGSHGWGSAIKLFFCSCHSGQ